MLIGLLVLLAVVSVPLTGGRLSRLASVSWRAPWLLLVALAIQVVVLETSWLSAVGPAAHLVSYALAATFVALNHRVTGLCLLTLGALCNGVTIAANGGTLPASPAALRMAGMDSDGTFTNSGIMDGARLPWLGDVFAVPAWVPLANVFSIGDVLIVAGAAWVAHAAARPDRPAAAGRHVAGRGAPSATAVSRHASRKGLPRLI